MLCIGPPPGLPANCRLPVAARSRPQCRAGVHARRSALASPHRAAQRQISPAQEHPPASGRPLPRRKPPKPPLQGEVPPQAAEGCRTSPCQYPPGSPHTLPHRQTSRQTAAYPSLPVPGHNVGRAFTPAAAALRHHTAPQTAACVDLQYAPVAPRLSRHTRFRPPPPPQASKASPVRGGAAAGGGGVPHLALPIPFRLAAHAPLPHICIGPDALHRPAAKPRGKLPLIRRCPFPATM